MLRGRLARNSAWAMAGTAIVSLSVFAETILLARYLPPETLGVLFLVLAYPEAVQQLLDFRVRDAMTRYLTAYLAQGERARAAAVFKLLWLADVGAGLATFAIVVVTSELAAGLIVGDEARSSLIALYAVGLLFGSLDSASGTVLRALDRFALSYALGGFAGLARLGGVAVAVASGGDLRDIVLARVIAEVLTVTAQIMVAAIVLRSVLGTDARAPLSTVRDRYPELRRFLLATNLTGVLKMASTKLDTILVGVLAGTSTVAIYKIALQFGRIPLLLGDALSTVVYPRFARSVACGDWQDLRRVAERTSLGIAIAVVPMALLGIIVGADLIAALAGERFRAAGVPFAIALTGVALYVVFFWSPSLILSRGRAGGLLRLTALATVLQLVALVVLVHAAGASGGATAFALLYVATAALQLGFIRRHGLLGAAPGHARLKRPPSATP